MPKGHKYYFKTDKNGLWIVWESPFKIEMLYATEEEKKQCKSYWQKLRLFSQKRSKPLSKESKENDSTD